MRTQFSTELGRAREAVTLAQERAEASERRALSELDAERTVRQQSERTAEALRGELVAARSEARDAAVAHEVRARLEAQAAALADRLAVAEQAQRNTAHDLDAVQAELGAAQRRAERAEAEAALARQLRNGPPSTVIDGLVESVCSSVYTWVKIRRRLPALAGRDCAQFSVVETARQTKHRIPRCEP